MNKQVHHSGAYQGGVGFGVKSLVFEKHILSLKQRGRDRRDLPKKVMILKKTLPRTILNKSLIPF